MDLHFSNMVRRWKREIENSDEKILLFSPYITSKTAETVLAAADPGTVEIHTRFEIIDFINGSSSLGTLERLAEDGHLLFEVPRLHAKVVIIPDRFVSIGSQNLTAGGQRNREATASNTDPEIIARAMKLVQPWIDSRRPIDLRRIRALAELIGPLRRRYLGIEKDIPNLERELESLEEKWRIEDEENTERAKIHRRRIAKLRNVLGDRSVASGEVTAYVRLIESFDSYRDPTSERYSLVVEGNHDLTQWIVFGEPIGLARLYRYPCILEDSGRLGWGRIGKTRITFIGQGISGAGKIAVAGLPCSVSFHANWQSLKESGWNIEVKIDFASRKEGSPLKFRGWFDLDRLHVDFQSPVDIARPSLAFVHGELLKNPDKYSQQIADILLDRFKYEHNLTGVEADSFFGSSGSTYKMRLVIIRQGHRQRHVLALRHL